MGYVGLPPGRLRLKSFEVIGIDIDAQRVDTITSGKAPFYEPGLGTLLKKALRTGSELQPTGRSQAWLVSFS